MPTYEYRCKTCEHGFEVVQAFTDDSLTECPECGGALKKVFGNVGITFKGSGFYKTDSRSAGSFGSAKDADRSDTGSSEKGTPSKDGGASSGDGGSGSSDKATEKKVEKKTDKPTPGTSSGATTSGSTSTTKSASGAGKT